MEGRRRRKLGKGELILNSPYVEPTRHWRWDERHKHFDEVLTRRPAGFVVATPGAQSHNDPGRFIPLDRVNQIRERVRAWRAENYPHVTGVTRSLLTHWREGDGPDRRGFIFCQLEAVETLIWLTEASDADRQGIEIPGDGGPFVRWCTKMATGSGKTIVMAMLIAWQTLNRTVYPKDPRFSKDFLVVAPGLTVRSRLQVLVPDSPENYYDQFHVIPTGMHDRLRQARVVIRNWHALDWESEAQIAKRRSVDKRGAKSDERYVRDVLGDMADARNLIVFNDEAHHAWRVPSGAKFGKEEKADVEEATKWVGGLDRIHRARKILRCFDLTATPFAPSGKRSDEEALFSWIVSDFGLNDAIECGLVKTPQVVIRDSGLVDADFRSRLFHIYRDREVFPDLNRKGVDPAEPLPQFVTHAYKLLGEDWRAVRDDWIADGSIVPPAMISVVNSTETAARVKYAFDHGRIDVLELCDPERTLHIDSKVLAQAEAQEQAPDLSAKHAAAEEEDESDESNESGPTKRLTKQQQAEELRRKVDTVGRQGQPGEKIQNVISVGMLSEGWDAKTVTHILGLRAFTSQLLCEQVVGRGLRRTTYDVDEETGFFTPEYVNVFGVPFTFLPHEDGSDTGSPGKPKKRSEVKALEDREAAFGITWPNVLRIEQVLRPELTLDLASVDVLTLDPTQTPTQAELAPMLDGKPHRDAVREIDLEKILQENRLQTLVFKASGSVYEMMQPKWQGAKQDLLAQLIRLVEKFLRSDRIRSTVKAWETDETRRRVLLMLNMGRIVQHVVQAIKYQSAEQAVPVFDSTRPIASTSDMRPWWTSRPTHPTEKSHIGLVVFDSGWEATEAYRLEKSELVEAWVKNDHLGFEILYVDSGVVRKYRPDFLVKLASGRMLILEVKGEKTDHSEAKRRAVEEWCRAVNSHGGFGHWSAAEVDTPGQTEDVLAKHADAVAALG